MVYIVLIIGTLFNIFNVIIGSVERLEIQIKERIFLLTNSFSELSCILFIASLVNYTEVNIVLMLGFISIWILSKAYILRLNISEVKGWFNMEDGIDSEKIKAESISNNNELTDSEMLEKGSASEEHDLKLSDEIENDINLETAEDISTHNSLHDKKSIEVPKEEKEVELKHKRRRTLALNASKINSGEGYN